MNLVFVGKVVGITLTAVGGVVTAVANSVGVQQKAADMAAKIAEETIKSVINK